MFILNLLTLASLFLFSFHTSADTRTFDRTWLGLFNKTKVTSDFSFWTEAQARLDNDRLTSQQLLFRFGVLKPLSNRFEVGLLYAYVQTKPLYEHRPTLQMTSTFFKQSHSSLTLRKRLEYRKLENSEAISGRFRASLRYQYRHFIVWEEPFINLTHETWTGERVFERNRFFIGRSFNSSLINLEVGYLNQYVPRHRRSLMEHVLVAYLFY